MSNTKNKDVLLKKDEKTKAQPLSARVSGAFLQPKNNDDQPKEKKLKSLPNISLAQVSAKKSKVTEVKNSENTSENDTKKTSSSPKNIPTKTLKSLKTPVSAEASTTSTKSASERLNALKNKGLSSLQENTKNLSKDTQNNSEQAKQNNLQKEMQETTHNAHNESEVKNHAKHDNHDAYREDEDFLYADPVPESIVTTPFVNSALARQRNAQNRLRSPQNPRGQRNDDRYDDDWYDDDRYDDDRHDEDRNPRRAKSPRKPRRPSPLDYPYAQRPERLNFSSEDDVAHSKKILANMPAYSAKPSLDVYKKQLVDSRTIIYYQQSLDLINKKEKVDPEEKRRAIVKRVARELWTNLCVRGQETAMLKFLHETLRKEYNENLQFEYKAGSTELMIMRPKAAATGTDGQSSYEAVSRSEQVDILNRAWQLAQDVVGSYATD